MVLPGCISGILYCDGLVAMAIYLGHHIGNRHYRNLQSGLPISEPETETDVCLADNLPDYIPGAIYTGIRFCGHIGQRSL